MHTVLAICLWTKVLVYNTLFNPLLLEYVLLLRFGLFLLGKAKRWSVEGVEPDTIRIHSGVRPPNVEAPVSYKLGERNTSSYCLISVVNRPGAVVASTSSKSALCVSTTNGDALTKRRCCDNLADMAADRMGHWASGATAPTCCCDIC